jgi:hypothetical protein
VTPEQAAAKLLEAAILRGRDALPVDVTFLAEEVEGLDVQERADLRALTDAPQMPAGAHLSGLLLPGSRRIWVDAVEAARSPGRRRFTIAHELGHWRLHAAGPDAQARFCRSDEVGGDPAQLAHLAELEREANRFAAALLMPEALVRELAAATRLSIPLMARRFGVSAPAMQVRLQTLSLLPDYMRR